MTGETISFLPLLDAMEHPEWLLKGLDGVQNDCGVYTGNVYRFLEGKLNKSYVEVKLCARRFYEIAQATRNPPKDLKEFTAEN